MKRALQIVILAAAIVIGVRVWRRVTPPAPVFPQMAGGWSIVGSKTCAKPAAANFPLWPGTSGARQVCRAEYAGSPPITLTIYNMDEGSAFGPFQEWETGAKPHGKALFRFRDDLYIEESPNADMNTLQHFAVAVLATRVKAE
jgi:hypothetical protein